MAHEMSIGVIADPASDPDLRRVIADCGAVTTHDELNRLLLTGLGSVAVAALEPPSRTRR